jgi:hypothetical protein
MRDDDLRVTTHVEPPPFIFCSNEA